MAAITSRLTDFFRRMRPQRPIQVSVTDTHKVATSLERLASGDVIDAPRKGGLLSKLPGAKRDAAIRQLQTDYREVIELVRAVRTHLDMQAMRSDRMLELMSRVPDVLSALPETNRNQARMLEAMQIHFEQQGRASHRLNEALGNLAMSAEHQSQVLGLIQQQLDSRSESEQQLTGTFTAMNQTLAHLGESTAASAQAMRSLTQRSDESDRRVEQVMEKTTKQMTLMMSIGYGLAGFAMLLALIAMFRH
jgi:hypothetical protein